MRCTGCGSSEYVRPFSGELKTSAGLGCSTDTPVHGATPDELEPIVDAYRATV
jgi:hypothetical protein